MASFNPIPRKLVALLILSSAIALIFLGTGWRPDSEPSWTHEFPGKGYIHSLGSCQPTGKQELLVAAGCADIDDEEADYHLVAFEPTTGRMIWQVRLPISMRGYTNLDLSVVEGEGGYPLLGSQWTAIPNTSAQAVAKHAPHDGFELWECSVSTFAPSAYRGAGFSAIPAASQRDHVWVTGILPMAERTYFRYLALVNAGNGRKLWQIQANSARDVFDSPCQIHCLSRSDAIVVSPPHHHERSYPWIFQRIEETTGNVVWSQEFTRDNERNLPDIAWLVDETGGQVLAFWSEVIGGKWHGEVISLDLTNGVLRWRTKSDFPFTLSGGILAAHLDAAGKISLWGRQEIRRSRTIWWKWTWDPELPIPFPQHEMKLDVRPIRIDLAATDGRLLGNEVLVDDDQSPTGVLRDPTSKKPCVLVLRQMRERAQIEPWSVLALDGFVIPKRAGGSFAKLWQPTNILLTRSAHIVTGNDPTEQDQRWQITAW